MKVKLRLAALSNMRPSPKVGMMTLVDDVENRSLVITCNNNVREQLSVRIDRGPAFSHDWLPEVMWRVLRHMGLAHFEVYIKGMKDGEYLVDLVCTINDERFPIRAGDAMLLAYVANLPIYADKALMDRQSCPWKPNSLTVSMPVNVIGEPALRDLLDDAVSRENYELASKIRDELKSREGGRRDSIQPET